MVVKIADLSAAIFSCTQDLNVQMQVQLILRFDGTLLYQPAAKAASKF